MVRNEASLKPPVIAAPRRLKVTPTRTADEKDVIYEAIRLLQRALGPPGGGQYYHHQTNSESHGEKTAIPAQRVTLNHISPAAGCFTRMDPASTHFAQYMSSRPAGCLPGMKLSVLAASAGVAAAKSAIGAVQMDFLVSRFSVQQGFTVDQLMSFERYAYVAELQVGSNKDKVSVVLDTHGSDLLVMLSNVLCDCGFPEHDSVFSATLDYCYFISCDNLTITPYTYLYPYQTDFANFTFSDFTFVPEATMTTSGSKATECCTAKGSFATDLSSWKKNDTDFMVPEFGVYGVWGKDNVNVGGVGVPEVDIAVVDKADLAYNVLGLGVKGLEFNNSKDIRDVGDIHSSTHDGLLSAMKELGIHQKGRLFLVPQKLPERHFAFWSR